MVWVAIGTALAVAGTLHTFINLRALRRPVSSRAITESVSVLIPARNEEHRLAHLLASLAAAIDVPDLEILVLDDNSTDGTAGLIDAASRVDRRVRLIESPEEPPAGWMGKQWACHRLAQQARGNILVFIDADVTLSADALSRAIATMRDNSLAVACPYPRQIAKTWLERLIQPLLQWSWASTLPLRIAERSTRESLVAANGQFLLIDRAAYQRCGGFASVRADVLDDIALVRAVKRSGGRGGVIDGTALATCRMYESARELINGYTKSLWSAFGGAVGSAAIISLLVLAYVVPAALLLSPGVAGNVRAIAMIGYIAGVLGRIAVGNRVQSTLVPDAFLHPLSVAAFAALNLESWRRKASGSLSWKGRAL